MNSLRDVRIGLAMTGSFCTFERVFCAFQAFKDAGAALVPILSYAVSTTDTRFGTAQETMEKMRALCGTQPLTTLAQVEPIGPQKRLDLLIVAPCTGNTCAKLAHGIADTPVTLACKSHLRNARPVLIGLSTNDGLQANAGNIGVLMARKHCYFVPFGQDDPIHKPTSLVMHADILLDAAMEALDNRQIQPVLQL